MNNGAKAHQLVTGLVEDVYSDVMPVLGAVNPTIRRRQLDYKARLQKLKARRDPDGIEQKTESLIENLVENHDDADWEEPGGPEWEPYTPASTQKAAVEVFLRPCPADSGLIEAVKLEDGGCIHQVVGTFRSVEEFKAAYPTAKVIRNYTKHPV